MLVFVAVTLFISILIGLIVIPRIVVISKKKRLFDRIDERKSHRSPVSRLGGIAFLPAMIIAFCLGMGIRYYYGYGMRLIDETQFMMEFMFFTAGAFLLFFLGMADDLIGISFKKKFFVQILAAIALVLGNVYLKDFNGLLGIYEVNTWAGSVCSVLFIVFVINAFNLIDGVDGLCSILGVLSLSVIGTLFIVNGVYIYAMMAFAFLGVLIVFYYYNAVSRKMKIFMGDSGSLILGYVIAFLIIRFCNENENGSLPHYMNNGVVVMTSVIFIPLFDTLRVFVSRLMRGHSPFFPDRTHIHHKFLRMGYSHLRSTTGILLLSVGFILLNFIMAFLGVNINIQLGINFALALFMNMLIDKAGQTRDMKTGRK